MKGILLAGVGAALLALLPGCYPKAQVYGVGNEGGLVFAVSPPDALVVLDGVIQGKASDYPEERYLKVPAGTHRLELRAPGFETHRREIYVSNSLVRIEKTLVRKGELEPAAPAAPGTGGMGGY